MRVQAATMCIQVTRYTRLRELHDALRRWLVDGERGAATSCSSTDPASVGRGRGRGRARARGGKGRGGGQRGGGAAAAAADEGVPVPLSQQRSRRTCYAESPSQSPAGA